MEYAVALFTFVVAHAPELVGFVLPPLVEVLNRDVKNSQERYIVALLVCFFTAAILNWHSLSTGNPQDAVSSMGLLFLESQAVFKLYFVNSLLRYKINPQVIPIKVEDRENEANEVLQDTEKPLSASPENI